MVEELEGHITVNEAAKRMARSTEQVRRYLREGRLPGKRIGGQWFIRETAVLYRTQQEEISEMSQSEPRPAGNLPAMSTNARLEIFERVNSQRENIRQRWEEQGIKIDAAELVRQTREEEQ